MMAPVSTFSVNMRIWDFETCKERGWSCPKESKQPSPQEPIDKQTSSPKSRHTQFGGERERERETISHARLAKVKRQTNGVLTRWKDHDARGQAWRAKASEHMCSLVACGVGALCH